MAEAALLIQLTKNYRLYIDFRGLRFEAETIWLSPPFTNRMESLGWKSHLFSSPENPSKLFLHRFAATSSSSIRWKEEGKGKDGDGRNAGHAHAVWEPDWQICQSS